MKTLTLLTALLMPPIPASLDIHQKRCIVLETVETARIICGETNCAPESYLVDSG